MKPYFFHPAAEEEFVAAAEYYRGVDPALAVAFFEEVESVIAHIRRFPAAGVKIDADIRRSLLSRFPYGVLYEERLGNIRILALMHLRRRPNYWAQRVEK